MSPAGSKIIAYPPLWRRSEQTGIIQQNFPARWLALLLMGSVGAAWALSPGHETGRSPALFATSKTVVEGDPLAVSQLVGSLLGEGALPEGLRQAPLATGGRRVVLQSVPGETDELTARREKARFLRTVEEVESAYMAANKYPAAPPAAAEGELMSYQTDGEEFTLKAGHRSYSTTEGLSFGAPPSSAEHFELKGYLAAGSTGWGPWKRELVTLQPGPDGQPVEGLAFLEELPLSQRGSARMFFPVDRATCGYLFHRLGGDSIYSSGELTYDAVSGSFALKLFRTTEVATHNLNAPALEKELADRDNPVVLVGETPLLADLGLAAVASEGEEVMVLSSGAALTCSTAQALDGLRFATLNRRKEVLPAGPFSQLEADSEQEQRGQASLVGRVQLADQLGQVHHLRVRGGRGANYDWLVGQLCPEPESTPVAGFIDSQAASCEDPVRPEERLVKAGR